MATESDLNILKLQVEQREKALGLEQKMLESMELQGKRAKDIATQRKKINELEKLNNKLKGQQLELEVSMSAELDRRAKRMKTTAMIMGGLQQMMSKIQDLSKRYSENTRKTADTMKINVNEAKKLNTEILHQLKGEKMYQTTMDDVAATAHEIGEAFGHSTEFTAKQAVDLDIAAKKLGISNTQAAKFTKLMFSSGESIDDMGVGLMAGTKALSEASGVKFEAVMEDIASNGESFANSFGLSGREIAKAAVAARRMGFELSDMVAMSEKLLDIEGGIEAQMKFNMLTGKNINLDKARALALEGKHEDMMQEVVKQAGNLEGLNQLEIKSLNEALGVDIMKLQNAEALAEKKKEEGIEADRIAAVQENLMNLQTAHYEQELVRDEAAATAEERKENFQKNMLDMMAEQIGAQDESNNLAIILQGIQWAIQGIMFAQTVTAALKARSEKKAADASNRQLPKLSAEAGLRSASAISALTTNSAITFGIGTVIALAAVGAAVAGMYALMSKPPPAPKAKPAGDLSIDPNGGPVIMTPKEGGIFQGSKNDGVSMSPNHGRNGGGGSIDIKPLIQKLDQLIAAVNKNRVLSVDGYALNEAMHLEKTPSGV